MKVVYLGFNSFINHKRGVENVIDFQSKSLPFESIYYVHKSQQKEIYRYGKFVCIGIKNNLFWPFILNFVLFKLKYKKKVKIHSHSPLLSFAYLGKTDILTVHDGLYYQGSILKSKFSWLFYLAELLVYLKVKMVHFVSEYSKSKSLFPKTWKNYKIIYNTCTLEDYVDVPNIERCLPECTTVLCVRSIEERARFDLLIEVASKLDNYVFNVAGKGPLLKHYREIVIKENLKNISFLGFITDEELVSLYKSADLVLVLAEYGEGFGLPIIEGYCFNKPVVASNKCAIPEVILAPEFLCQNSVNSIIQVIEHALAVPTIEYKIYYDEKFSKKIICDQIADLYNLLN